MAPTYDICLVGAMDSLWFHHIILFSEPASLLVPKTLKTPLPILELHGYQSSIHSISEDEVSVTASATTLPQVGSEIENENRENQIPTRPNVIPTKSHSQSSSPSTPRRLKNLKHLGPCMNLQKTMSCKTLWELEVEEVKGFMDLGFNFERENLSPRMMSVLPGLQRLGCLNKDQNDIVFDDKNEEKRENANVNVMRPYLSEAWMIKRHDLPLINLRIPKRNSRGDDMKKHLRDWAKIVATVIQQES